MSDVLSIIGPALPFLVIAAAFYGLARLRRRGGAKGLTEAQRLLAAGDRAGARHLLVTALWKANESPNLERTILQELTALYHQNGVAFDPGNYDALIRQYETLSKGKTTGRAMREIKRVLVLKQELIDRMPQVASATT